MQPALTRPEPMRFQVEGAAWLAPRKRGLLCDEMGLGKTCQAIMAADAVGARDILVLAPAAVTPGWVREFAQWSDVGRPASVVRKPGDVDGAGVRVASYDRARDPASLNAMLARRWDLLICDEADLLKNRTAARTQAVLGPGCGEVGGLISAADRAWGLTGTPMPNSADELWTLLKAFAPEALGEPALSYWAFRKRYCVEVPIGPHKTKIVSVRNAAELKDRVTPHMLRRRMDDVLPDLPPMDEVEWPIQPGAYALDLAAGLAADPELAALSVGFLARSLLFSDSDVADWISKMLQEISEESSSRLRRVTGAVKARALGAELAREMAASTEKLVVMGWHTEVLDAIEASLAPFGTARLSGGVSPAQRQEAIDAFQSDPGTRVFIGQIIAAGAGITLTAGAEIVFAEMSWVPRDNAQAARRIRRIGQTRRTRARYPVLVGTIDEAVVRTNRRKTAGIRSVVT